MSKRPPAVAQLVFLDLVFNEERVLYERECSSFHDAVRLGKAGLIALIKNSPGPAEDFALVVLGTNGKPRFRWQVASTQVAPLGPRLRPSSLAE